MDRVVLVARLKPGARERAEELLADKARSNAPEAGFARQTTFLSESEVIFLLEGPDAVESVRAVLNDPVASTMIAPWLPLFDGPLHRAREAHSWER